MTEATVGLERPIAPFAGARALAGATASLVALPFALVAWTALWGLGPVSSAVGYPAAMLAAWLYRVAAGGVGRAGRVVLPLVVAVELVLSASLAAAVHRVLAVARATHEGWRDVIAGPGLGADLLDALRADPLALAGPLLFGLAFAALALLSALRSER